MQTLVASSRRQIIWRRIILLGTPLLLGAFELGHPLLDHENPIRMLAPIVVWWITLHLLLIPLFVLMGVAIFLLLQDIESRAAMLSRCAAAIYISFTIGYDTAVGLGSGILVNSALSLSSAQQATVLDVMHGLFASPAITLSYYILFFSGVLAICSAVWALLRSGVPRLPALVLLGALFTIYTHATPFGPLGDVCFFLSTLWIELVWRKLPRDQQDRSLVPASSSATQTSA